MTQSGAEKIVDSGAVSILIVADTPAGQRRCRIAGEAIGARVVSFAEPTNAIERMSQKISLDAALVDLTEDHGKTLDALLGAIESHAVAGRHRSVVSVPIELVDIVDAHISHSDVQLLCSPGQGEQAAALIMATAKRDALLQDITGDRDEERLRRLSEEVGRIARTLEELSYSDSKGGNGDDRRLAEAPFAFRAEPSRAEPLRSDDIRSMIRMRRLRDRFFDGDLFADPAWDMLLDLMAARLEGRQVAVSSLCIAAAVPPTTALRWIRTMTDRGLFVRRSDPRDGRRVFIELADEAAHALGRWFAAAKQNGDVLTG